MFIAKNKKGLLVDIDDAIESVEQEYFCPCCNGEVCIKNGMTNVSHFAHKRLDDCDTFTQDMSEWHRRWQRQFPLRNREVGLPHDQPIHRADVLACGFVIEFQHSTITRDEFNLRNEFYTFFGKKVIWIFDMRDVIDSERMAWYDEWEKGAKWRWRYAWKIFEDWNPVRDKDIMVFFQVSDYDFNDEDGACHIEQVVWAINKDGVTNMKRFSTSYEIGNFTELKEYILEEYNRKTKHPL